MGRVLERAQLAPLRQVPARRWLRPVPGAERVPVQARRDAGQARRLRRSAMRASVPLHESEDVVGVVPTASIHSEGELPSLFSLAVPALLSAITIPVCAACCRAPCLSGRSWTRVLYNLQPVSPSDGFARHGERQATPRHLVDLVHESVNAVRLPHVHLRVPISRT